MKKLYSLIFSLALLFTFSLPTAAVTTSAQSAVLINADTLRVIYEHNMKTCLPMASTTKIMTGLLLAEQNTPQKTVNITKEMVAVEGSSMGLKAGDTVSYKDLLYGLMLASGNDAANTVAISLCGSTDEFAKLMNDKAKQIGLRNTNFVTPSGLDDENHYTTAYDLAILTAYALKNDEFLKVVSTKSAKLEYCGVYVNNHNKLLKIYDGAIGVKTGFTKRSGRCLVSAAKRGNTTLIAITLNDKNDWDDHKNLLDYGFQNSREETLSFTLPSHVRVANSNNKLYIKANPIVCALSLQDDLTYDVNLPSVLFAPIKMGEKVGEIEVYCNGKSIATSNITAQNSVYITEKENKIFKILNIYLNLIRSF